MINSSVANCQPEQQYRSGVQLSLFPSPPAIANILVGGSCSQAVEHNLRVINNYGPQKFKVVHSGGVMEDWSANNRQHLDLLLRVQKNLGYMLSIDEVRSVC